MDGFDGRLWRAKRCYEQAVFGGDEDAIAAGVQELDGLEADLALTRGQLMHARFLEERVEDPREVALFHRALEIYRGRADARGECEALFWIGTFHQVVRQDLEAALPLLEQSYALAGECGDMVTRAYAARHLGYAAMEAGDPAGARSKFEESLHLRQEVGLKPAIAAAMLPLAELAAAQGDRDGAVELLNEAESIARASESLGVIGWLEEARAEVHA